MIYWLHIQHLCFTPIIFFVSSSPCASVLPAEQMRHAWYEQRTAAYNALYLLSKQFMTLNPVMTHTFPQQQSDTRSSYIAEVEAWRKAHEEKLRAENGWLSLVGLHWLESGDNWLGSDVSNTIRLPSQAPATLGVLRVDSDTSMPHLRFFPATNVPVVVTRADGSVVNLMVDSSHTLAFDDDRGSKPDIISVGDISLFVVRRMTKAGMRFGVRVRDKASPARMSFKGCVWFPVKPECRVRARFHEYSVPKIIDIENVLGGIERRSIVGRLEFTIQGKYCSLEVEKQGSKLFCNFRDGTSGTTTYPAGRFLYAELPSNGRTILDFNKAENPPCAFVGFTTCPLPPRGNWLPVSIEAGEKIVPVIE
ncbi:MAG: DUF1684 domain-containing protein [Bacteroidota bacterium]|nr:DUF1684 domain-containing protein [Candidatus Kapabacteria bacterium]MDW8220193.1 DUF1684 domain-containing protein [Bacteroidota bacterium]